jgi:hypothetical protein
MNMRETWYVLEDGNAADPNEVSPDENGVLRNKSGVAVAIGPHGPKSTGVDVEAERAKSQKDMKPQGETRGYKTRESKAR